MPSFEPTGRAKVADFKIEVTAENLAQLVGLYTAVDPEYWWHKAADMMCLVHNADAPWVWHLQRCMRKYPVTAWRNKEWVQQFITEYFKVISFANDHVLENTGEHIGFHTARI